MTDVMDAPFFDLALFVRLIGMTGLGDGKGLRNSRKASLKRRRGPSLSSTAVSILSVTISLGVP